MLVQAAAAFTKKNRKNEQIIDINPRLANISLSFKLYSNKGIARQQTYLFCILMAIIDIIYSAQ